MDNSVFQKINLFFKMFNFIKRLTPLKTKNQYQRFYKVPKSGYLKNILPRQ